MDTQLCLFDVHIKEIQLYFCRINSYRYVGINATDINHSAGRYNPGQSPPLEAGLEVRVL